MIRKKLSYGRRSIANCPVREHGPGPGPGPGWLPTGRGPTSGEDVLEDELGGGVVEGRHPG